VSKTNDAPVDETETQDDEPAKLVVASQIRAFIKSQGYCVSGDLIDALSSRVRQIVMAGILRADSNGRKTVRGSDI
jgi:histone H3/H4